MVFEYNWYSAKKTMWFIGVEVEQEASAPPPKKNPGSAPVIVTLINTYCFYDVRVALPLYHFPLIFQGKARWTMLSVFIC